MYLHINKPKMAYSRDSFTRNLLKELERDWRYQRERLERLERETGEIREREWRDQRERIERDCDCRETKERDWKEAYHRLVSKCIQPNIG